MEISEYQIQFALAALLCAVCMRHHAGPTTFHDRDRVGHRAHPTLPCRETTKPPGPNKHKWHPVAIRSASMRCACMRSAACVRAGAVELDSTHRRCPASAVPHPPVRPSSSPARGECSSARHRRRGWHRHLLDDLARDRVVPRARHALLQMLRAQRAAVP